MPSISGVAADIYRSAPYPVRVATASVHGLRLGRRRYGSETEVLAAEAIEREHWDTEQWHRWQQARLDEILRVARDRVPAYAAVSSAAGNGRGLDSFPVLSKAQLRSNPDSFVRTDAPRRLIVENTSGTSGTPLKLKIGRADYRLWYALAEARWRHWYGVSRHDRWAILGAQLVVAPTATEPPYWVWNAGLRQLYLCSHHVSDARAADYVKALDDHRVTYLLGYPSTLYSLALACRSQGVRPRPMRAVVSNAEPLHAHQREVIADVFGGPVRETYGMAEYVAAASECEHGSLHLWPEVGVVEVLSHDGSDPVPAGASGRLVCSGLVNSTMPLVRYDVGDAGALEDPDRSCACGRTLPMLSHLEGRCDDLVKTLDGRRIGQFGGVFHEMPVRAAQIVQDDRAHVRVLVVPDGAFDERLSGIIANRLRNRVGDMAVSVDVVEDIPTGPNGKFKMVVSHLDAGG